MLSSKKVVGFFGCFLPKSQERVHSLTGRRSNKCKGGHSCDQQWSWVTLTAAGTCFKLGTSVNWNSCNERHPPASPRGQHMHIPVKYVLTRSILVQSPQRRQHVILWDKVQGWRYNNHIRLWAAVIHTNYQRHENTPHTLRTERRQGLPGSTGQLPFAASRGQRPTEEAGSEATDDKGLPLLLWWVRATCPETHGGQRPQMFRCDDQRTEWPEKSDPTDLRTHTFNQDTDDV